MKDTQAERKSIRDGRNIHPASYDGIALLREGPREIFMGWQKYI